MTEWHKKIKNRHSRPPAEKFWHYVAFVLHYISTYLSRDLVVLKVLLAVEGDLLGLHLAVLHLNLVAAEHNRNVLTHARQISVTQTQKDKAGIN